MNYQSQPSQFAYIDESGDPYLDLSKEGTSKFYVVTAVLVDGFKNQKLTDDVEVIRQQYFDKGEMKSSGIGSNIKRRTSLIQALSKTDLKFFSVVVDKSKIDLSSGLQFKKSFIKYIHSRLYKRLYKSFSNLHIYADEHGRSDFMRGFESYLKKRYQRGLFDHEDFSFVKSHDYSLVQSADVIGGTLLRIASGKDPVGLLELLSESAIIVEHWPPSSKQTELTGGLLDTDKFDHLVSQQGIMLVRSFIDDESGSNDENIQAQVETLRFLLYQYELDSAQYIHAQPILDYINLSLEEPLSLQTFRTNIIGKLRSKGVIIASSNRGYKIPNSAHDISDFVSMVDGLVLPYLRRLSKARSHLLLSSNGEYDIIHPDTYPQLSKCIEIISE